MEKTNYNDQNRFVLRGPIVKKMENDVAVNLIIKTPRQNLPNVTGENEAAYNYPEVSFYKELKEQAASFKEGDVVEIKGTIHPRKKISPDTGYRFYNQTLNGTEIKRAERILKKEFDINKGPYEDPMNRVILVGLVSYVSNPSRGIHRINIQTYVDGKLDNVQTFLYRNANPIAKGDKVVAVGSIQTLWKKQEDGQDKHYRNIVLESLYKID